MQQVNVKRCEKVPKIAKIEEEIFISSDDLMNFNAIFKKNLTCDNIKSHKKSGLHPLSRKQISEEPQGGSNWPTHTSFLRLNKELLEPKLFDLL